MELSTKLTMYMQINADFNPQVDFVSRKNYRKDFILKYSYTFDVL